MFSTEQLSGRKDDARPRCRTPPSSQQGPRTARYRQPYIEAVVVGRDGTRRLAARGRKAHRCIQARGSALKRRRRVSARGACSRRFEILLCLVLQLGGADRRRTSVVGRDDDDPALDSTFVRGHVVGVDLCVPMKDRPQAVAPASSRQPERSADGHPLVCRAQSVISHIISSHERDRRRTPAV